MGEIKINIKIKIPKPKEILRFFKKIPRQIFIGAGLTILAGLLLFFGISSILNPPDGYKEFQQGVLSLKNNDAEQAVRCFREVVFKSGDKEVVSIACYNIGTIYFNAALEQGSIDLLKNAISSFRESLRQDPTNRMAKYNLELALRYLASAQQQGGEQQPMNPGRQGSDDTETPEW